MKLLLAAASLAALVHVVPVHAQSQIDHDVQRAWDNLFDPDPPGDPRTHWERRRDRVHYLQQRAAEHTEWCRAHPGAGGCRGY